MEESSKSRTDHTIDSQYNDSDLTSQLREKIRTQAQRLRSLEQYRVLCEQRIQDLFPSHPLPIRIEHLGQVSSTQSDLQSAKQKIARLEAQIHKLSSQDYNEYSPNDFSDLLEKYNKLVIEKNQTDESLRSEMLACEEQRTYIEILKQAVESKLEQQGVVKVERQSQVDNLKSQAKGEEFKREYAILKSNLLDCESQVKRMDEKIIMKENEVEMVKRENSKLDQALKDASEALSLAEDEVSKLEEEKNALIEYVDQHSAKEQKMENDISELSRYFEDVQAESESLRNQLEDERKSREKLEIESEVINEEIYKANQLIKDLQDKLDAQKSGNEDKETLLRKIKDEKLSYEIKLESLQANATTLAETLKETQIELEDTQAALEKFKRHDYSKDETIAKLRSDLCSMTFENKSLKETLDEVSNDLVLQKNEHLSIEKLREIDLKHISDLKASINQYKAKYEIITEDRHVLAESEQFRKIDNAKLQSLQKEYIDLQDAYRESQQRELIQSEALNELRKHNSELSHDLEALFKEQEQSSAELMKKASECEASYAKLAELTRALERTERHKGELESALKTEKSDTRILKSQISEEKSKAEAISGQLTDVSSRLDKILRRYKDKDDEYQSLRLLYKEKERALEEEKYSKAVIEEETIELASRYDYKDKELQRLQKDIQDSCRLIINFCSTSSYKDSPSISPDYQSFLTQTKEKAQLNVRLLAQFISITSEELESISKQFIDLLQSLDTSTNELYKLSSRVENASFEETSYKSENQKLRIQLESYAKKLAEYSEVTEKEVNTLRLEVSSLKNDLGCLGVENSALRDSLHKTLSENNELRMNSEVFKLSLKAHEDSSNHLKTEKYQLELLLSKLQQTNRPSEAGRIHAEIARINADLELFERERLNLHCQLLKFESDSRARDTPRHKEICNRLAECESKVKSHKNNLQILNEALTKEEKLWGNDKDSVRKSVSISNPSLQMSLMQSRQYELPQSLRPRTTFN